MGMEARRTALDAPEVKDLATTKTLREILIDRERLLKDWTQAHKDRLVAEQPARSPEAEAAEFKTDLARTRTALDELAKAPDSLMPEAFQSGPASPGKTPEGRLAEMKEAIDAARADLKERAADLDSIRSAGTNALATGVAADRAERDKVHQAGATLGVSRAEQDAKVAAASAPEVREIAQERLTNLEWDCRVSAERLAALEAKILLNSKRLDLFNFQVQAKAARVQLAKGLLGRMEGQYAALAEKQRSDLKKAVASEENRAARSDDPIERYRARRTAELLDLESQVVAYEKANATTSGLSLQEQTSLADATVVNFVELKGLLDDGNVSPLDVLRLKNDFRRIVPERAQIVRTDLTASDAELTLYENALTDAEIDLVNDSRDDRFDRDSLLEQVPQGRRVEAKAISAEIEVKYKALLNRRRAVLQKLARRAEEIHAQVVRRIEFLDKHYAFIRTHIFWVRDAEPLGPATLAHARDDAVRTAKAVVHLAIEMGNRTLWVRPSPEFFVVVLLLVVAPGPILIALKALDRYRRSLAPETGLALADFEPAGIEG